MIRAFNPSRPIANINRDTIQIWCAPGGFCSVLGVIARALFSADRSSALNTFKGSGMNANPGLFKDLSETMDCNGSFFAIDNMHTITVEIQNGF